MAGITFGGLASGLPTDDIITQLMELERQPLDRLEAQKTTEDKRLQAFGQLNDKLDALRATVSDMTLTSQVQSSQISVSADAPFTAVSNGASTGSYDIAVVQLAQVQKSVSNSYASQTDSIFGTGTLTLGGQSIHINADNNSLSGLREAINAVSEKSGVQASIINDGSGDTPYRLVLTGKDASSSFEPVFTLTDDSGNAIDPGITQTREAQQAVAYVDGVKVVSGSNTLKGVISGVTISLNETSTLLSPGIEEPGVDPSEWGTPPQYQTTTMTVKPDTDALKEKLTNFVDSYNELMDWISSGYSEFGASAPTEEEIEAGAEESLSNILRGDSTVNGVKRQLQGLLSSVIGTSGAFKTMSSLGISTQRDGSLKVDESDMDKALDKHFDDVAKLLAGEGSTDGIMKKFNYALLDLTSYSDGMYANKQARYDTAIKRLDANILRLEPLIDKKEATLRAQFGAMETLVSGMNSQSSFLTQQMDMLTNMMTGKK